MRGDDCNLRYRVDFRNGLWASFDESDEALARECYLDGGIRLRMCRGIHDDEGDVIAGLPLVIELGGAT